MDREPRKQHQISSTPTGISMRELERELPPTSARVRVAIVGGGRLGRAIDAALREAGHDVVGPLGRGADPVGVDAVLLCVPDREIAAAARCVSPGPLVGHCSGATGLEALSPHEAFSLHPLMTVTARGASFRGAGAAIAGGTERSLEVARTLAAALGLRAVEIDERDRVAYHAAASVASNFLVTLEAAAERIAASAGVDRALLVPLVRATIDNWETLGPDLALTGPVARGDEETVARQRGEIAARTPELVALFDALTDATRALARRGSAEQRNGGSAEPPHGHHRGPAEPPDGHHRGPAEPPRSPAEVGA
jgi:predicted short-subunit dehydrogenase-like oxidoreductase (DUF2520 family)